MKKAWVIWWCSVSFALALNTTVTLDFYHRIFEVLVGKPVVRVYVGDKELRDVFVHSDRVQLVDDPAQSDVVILDGFQAYEQLLPQLNALGRTGRLPVVIANSYRVFKRYKEAIVAFYWYKGRPQLLFLRHRLAKRGIVLPHEFDRYILDEL